MYTHNQLLFPTNMEVASDYFVITGFAHNGPVNTPFQIRDGVNPEEVLGSCRMTDSIRMAREYGIRPLLLRLNGAHAECELSHHLLNRPVIKFKTVEARSECNNISLHVFPTHLVVNGLHGDLTYLFSDYQRVSQLVSSINRDMHFARGEVLAELMNEAELKGICSKEYFVQMDGADTEEELISFFDNTGAFDEESEEDETTTEDLFFSQNGEEPYGKVVKQLRRLRELFINIGNNPNEPLYTGELTSFPIDTILFTDIPYESAPAELVSILGHYANTKTQTQDRFCSVVLGSSSFLGERYDESGEDTFAPQIERLKIIGSDLNAPEDIIFEEDELGDNSFLDTRESLKHVEVVVGTQNSMWSLGFVMSCAPNYACMRYSLENLHTSATNQPLENITNTFNSQLSKTEIAMLSSSGYIFIVPSIRRGFTPYSSRNVFLLDTIHSKPHTLRSIIYDVKQVVKMFERHVGEPFTYLLMQSTLQKAAEYVEDASVNNPIYKNVTIEILSATTSRVDISMSFEVYGEIEAIITSFSYVPDSEVYVVW